jgi:hypothetical protein
MHSSTHPQNPKAHSALGGKPQTEPFQEIKDFSKELSEGQYTALGFTFPGKSEPPLNLITPHN